MVRKHVSKRRGGHKNAGLKDRRVQSADSAKHQALALGRRAGSVPAYNASQQQKRIEKWTGGVAEYDAWLSVQRQIVHQYEPTGLRMPACKWCGASANDLVGDRPIHGSSDPERIGLTDEWFDRLADVAKKIHQYRKLRTKTGPFTRRMLRDQARQLAIDAFAYGCRAEAIAAVLPYNSDTIKRWVKQPELSGNGSYERVDLDWEPEVVDLEAKCHWCNRKRSDTRDPSRWYLWSYHKELCRNCYEKLNTKCYSCDRRRRDTRNPREWYRGKLCASCYYKKKRYVNNNVAVVDTTAVDRAVGRVLARGVKQHDAVQDAIEETLSSLRAQIFDWR